MIEPPDDVSDGILFRILLQTPRPIRKISYRIPKLEHIELFVRGLRGIEEAAAVDLAEESHIDEARMSLGTSALIATSLCDSSGGLCFSSNRGPMLALSEDEFRDLLIVVTEALRIVSPTYHRINFNSWSLKLRNGAKSPPNQKEAVKMSYCVDYGIKGMLYRPDRYFGMPMKDITDGQMIAYESGVAAIKELRGEE